MISRGTIDIDQRARTGKRLVSWLVGFIALVSWLAFTPRLYDALRS